MTRKEDAYKLASKRLIEDILHDNEERASKRVLDSVDPSSARGRAQRFVGHQLYSRVATVLLIMNAIYLGVETELNHCESNFDSAAWPDVETAFVVLCVADVLLRIFAERMVFCTHSWNLWDAGLVFLAAFDVLILEYSSPRARRLLRQLLIVRVVRFVEELWFLAEGILLAIRTLAWAWLLVFFQSYICAILLTRTLGKSEASDDADLEELFGTLPRSMLTLFQVMTTEGWADVARRCMTKGSLWGLFFILFISATTLALMNVVAAVVVQNTLEHASQRSGKDESTKDNKEQTALLKIVEVFRAADADCDGEVTRTEFCKALENPMVVQLLHDVGVDVRQAESLFDILDYNDSGSLDANEFVEGVLMARGEANAKEVLAVQCDMWKMERKLTCGLDHFTQHLGTAVKDLSGVIASLQKDFEAVEASAPKLFKAAKKARLDPTADLSISASSLTRFSKPTLA